jgi:hypothetical protein
MSGARTTEATSADPLTALDAGRRAAFTAVANRLIPAAHGMPSAGGVVGDARLRFVLNARPDLLEPLMAALRPGLGDDPSARLAVLEREEPDHHAVLVLAVVSGYYTDGEVRRRLGYPGQLAKQINAWRYPEYLEGGLIEKVLARGAVWRDPVTGRRAEATYSPQEMDGSRAVENAETAHSNRETT